MYIFSFYISFLPWCGEMIYLMGSYWEPITRKRQTNLLYCTPTGPSSSSNQSNPNLRIFQKLRHYLRYRLPIFRCVHPFQKILNKNKSFQRIVLFSNVEPFIPWLPQLQWQWYLAGRFGNSWSVALFTSWNILFLEPSSQLIESHLSARRRCRGR